MSMAVVAVGVSAATIGAGIYSAKTGAAAARDAANTQADAARDANATQLEMFERSRADLEPYRGYGRTALVNLERTANEPLSMRPYTPTAPFEPTPVYRGPSEADLRADPGYLFRVEQGQKALERSAAGKGLLLSGGQLKDLTRFGQGQGAQEYAAAYQRGYQLNADLYGRGYQQNADLYGRNLQAYQTDYNTLMGLRKERYGEFAGIAGAGQGAVNTLSSLGAKTAEQLNENTIGAGNAQAAGAIGSANAVNAGLSSVGQAGNSYLQYQLLSSLMNRNGNAGYNAGGPSTLNTTVPWYAQQNPLGRNVDQI
jgi:hypothetical protein